MTLLSMDWQDRAKCAAVGANPDIFFPDSEEGRGGAYAQAKAEAKAICRSCPVRDQCLQFALATRQKFGVWGGYTPKERRALQRRSA